MKTIDHVVIETYLTESITLLTEKQEAIQNLLAEQFQRFSMTFVDERINGKLEDFVKLHHIDMKRKIHHQINAFRDEILTNSLERKLFSFQLTNGQVNYFSSDIRKSSMFYRLIL